MTDPAEYIARNWYIGMNLIYEGVDFGRCMEYDVLQVVNRSILNQQEQEAKETNDRGTEASSTHDGELHNSIIVETSQ